MTDFIDLPPTDQLDKWCHLKTAQKFTITEEMIDRFADLSGDHSPIHVDQEYARSRGLENRIAHGALLGSLVSSLLGEKIPGKRGILQELSLQFRKPCYPGDSITIAITVKEVFTSVNTIRMKIQIRNQHGQLISSGYAQSGVAEK